MNTKKIREALNAEIAALKEDRRYTGFKRPVDERIEWMRSALAELEAHQARARDLEAILATYQPYVRDDMRKHMAMYPNRSKKEYDRLANEFAFLTRDADRARHAPLH